MSQREIRGQTLVLQGALLTTVNWCDAYDQHENKLLTALSALRFATNPDSHIAKMDSIFDAVWKTLIVDDPPPTLDQEACPDTFRAWLLSQMRLLWRECENRTEEHRLYRQEMETLLTPSSSTQHFFTLEDIQTSSLPNPNNPQIAAFHVAFKVAMRGRVLFITSAGHLGLGMRSMKVNDEVWVLKGVNVPLILRRREDGMYEIVGESYVHGVMYGEGMEGDVEAQFGDVEIV
jgi:hypothetical protein